MKGGIDIHRGSGTMSVPTEIRSEALGEAMTCRRLIGKAGEPCQTCGRVIVRREGLLPGNYSLQHEGPSIGDQLAALQKRRGRGSSE